MNQLKSIKVQLKFVSSSIKVLAFLILSYIRRTLCVYNTYVYIDIVLKIRDKLDKKYDLKKGKTSFDRKL